jgi:hypothetical protein
MSDKEDSASQLSVDFHQPLEGTYVEQLGVWLAPAPFLEAIMGDERAFARLARLGGT